MKKVAALNQLTALLDSMTMSAVGNREPANSCPESSVLAAKYGCISMLAMALKMLASSVERTLRAGVVLGQTPIGIEDPVVRSIAF